MIPGDIIDLEPIIRQAGGIGRRDLAAIDRAEAFLIQWHGPMTRENIIIPPVGDCRATIQLAHCARGHWLCGISFQHNAGGRYCGPHVFDRQAYRTRDAAMEYGRQEAIAWFRNAITSWNSCVSQTTRNNARRMVAELEKQAAEALAPVQLDLFGAVS